MNNATPTARISALETAIREKAKIVAKQAFQATRTALLSRQGTRNGITNCLDNQEKELLQTFLDRLEADYAAGEADKAVRIFMQTYDKLLLEFPTIAEDLRQEGFEQGVAEATR